MIPRLGAPYWRVWTASTCSSLGTGLTWTATSLLAASYTHDPRLVSLVGAASFLPALLIGLPAGAVVDRSDRRRVMWQTDAARAVLMVALAGMAVSRGGGIALLCLLCLLLGAGEVLFSNASSAMTPMLVAGPSLSQANAWLLSGQVITAEFIGLPLGAVLYALSPGLPFGADAATFAIAALLVVGLPGTFRTDRGGPTTLRQDVREGVAWLWSHSLLRLMAVLLAVINLTFAAGESTLVLLALDRLHVGQLGYSLLLTTAGIGALVGSFATPRLQRRIGISGVIRLSLVAMVVGLAIPGLTRSVALVGLAFALSGAGGMLWNIVSITLRQDLVPAPLLGRVIAAYRLVGVGTIPIGAALGGLVAHAGGLPAPYLLSAVLLGVAAVICLPRLGAGRLDAALAEPVS